MPDNLHPQSVALHIGAHKTATTHLQRSFLDSAAALAAAGVQFHGPASFRGDNQTLTRRFGITPRPSESAQPMAADALSGLSRGAAHLILSEENFPATLGNRWGNVGMPLYADAPRRVRILAKRIAPASLDVFLAIRHPTTFLNSAYGQVLLAGRYVKPERFHEKNPLVGVDWADLVERLRATPGLRRLTVWRYEDYQTVFPQIAEAMAGPAAGPRVSPVETRVHQRLSALAVSKLAESVKYNQPRPKVAVLQAAFPTGPDFPAFDVFDQASHDIGTDAYAAQIARIDAMADVTRLRP